METKSIALGATLLLLSAACMWTYLTPEAVEPKTVATDTRTTAKKRLTRHGKKTENAKAAVQDALRNATIAKKPRNWLGRSDPDRMYAHLKGKDRTLAEQLQRGLDEADFKNVAAAADAAASSKNPEVRELAVYALGWFGAEALPELTVWMADPDEDVAQAAMNLWEQGLTDIASAENRLSITAAALGTLTDREALESLSGQFSIAATEFIDEVDEDEQADEARERRIAVVQTLYDLIENGNDVQSVQAMETYSDITGFAWRGADEAERYLQNPDDYDDEPTA